MELAGKTDDAITGDERCRASRMKGPIRARTHHQVDAEHARHARSDVDGVRPRGLAPGPPPSAGLARAADDTGVPVAFGVLTTDTIEQAIERSGTKAGNKGADAALCALELANLLRKLDV